MKKVINIILFFILNFMSFNNCNSQNFIKCKGPVEGNFIIKFAYNENNLFACSYGAGIFVSTDLGVTWKQINNGLTDLNIWDLDFIDNKIFAATEKGLFVSIDTGNNWLPDKIVTNNIHNFRQYKNKLYAYDMKGIFFISYDKGENWIIQTSWANAPTNCFNIKNDTLFLSGSLGIFTSVDDGKTWFRYYWSTADILYLYILKDTIIACEMQSSTYISTDMGRTWQEWNISNNVNIPLYIYRIIENNNIFYASCYNHSVIFSTDRGNSWETVKELTNDKILGLIVYKNYLFAGAYDGVYRADLTTVGITDEIKSEVDISIFPNPATDFIEISLNNGFQPVVQSGIIEIYNFYGLRVLTTPSTSLTPLLREGECWKIDVSGLLPGVYFVRVGDKIEKFIKY